MAGNALRAGLIHRSDDSRLQGAFKLFEIINEDEDITPVDTMSLIVNEETTIQEIRSFIAGNHLDAIFFPLTLPNCLALKIADLIKSERIPIKTILATDGGSAYARASRLFDKVTDSRDLNIGRLEQVTPKELSSSDTVEEIKLLLRKEQCFAKRMVGDHHYFFIATERWSIEDYERSKSDSTFVIDRTFINLATQSGSDEDRRLFADRCSAYANISRGSQSKSPRRNDSHLIILLHGINTFAGWTNAISSELRRRGFKVAVIGYGFISVLMFLLPFDFVRRKAVESMLKQIRIAVSINRPERMSLIAHSFGTYVACRATCENTEIIWDRIILCGSVLSNKFPLDKLNGRVNFPILNEASNSDIWPAVAESLTWGYGWAGSNGLLHPMVQTRWNSGYKHSDYLNADHCRAVWLPFLEDGSIRDGDEPLPRGFSQVLAVVKIKYLILLAIAFVAILIARPSLQLPDLAF